MGWGSGPVYLTREVQPHTPEDRSIATPGNNTPPSLLWYQIAEGRGGR